MLNYIKDVLENMPSGWLNLTTHRLDIYDEKLAKTQFLEQFDHLFNSNNSAPPIAIGAIGAALNELPTAYDYIRLGHPLSCVLEWAIAKLNNIKAENVISFSSHRQLLFWRFSGKIYWLIKTLKSLTQGNYQILLMQRYSRMCMVINLS